MNALIAPMNALRNLLSTAPPPPTGLGAVLASVNLRLGTPAPGVLPLRLLTAASLAGSSLGWVRPIWFISVGE